MQPLNQVTSNFDFSPLADMNAETALAIGIVVAVAACLGFAFGAAWGLGVR